MRTITERLVTRQKRGIMSEYDDSDRCLACGEFPDYCQGGHGQGCNECRGWLPDHKWVDGRFSGMTLCGECGLLPLDSDDMETGCPIGASHEPFCVFVEHLPWVDVYQDYDYTHDAILEMSTHDAVNFMRGADYGMETDDAHTYVHQPHPDAAFYRDPDHTAPWGANDDVTEHLGYVMIERRGLYVGLHRRAIATRERP